MKELGGLFYALEQANIRSGQPHLCAKTMQNVIKGLSSPFIQMGRHFIQQKKGRLSALRCNHPRMGKNDSG